MQLLLRSALDILKRVLYVLSLLQSMRKLREASTIGVGGEEHGHKGAHNANVASSEPLSDVNKAAVVELWREMESCVTDQLFCT